MLLQGCSYKRGQWFNGDGNIAAFTIKDGTVSFRQRYVRTEKFTREREAKRALLGIVPSFLNINQNEVNDLLTP